MSTGSIPVDSLLKGGVEKRAITCLYGSAGTGKTSLAISAAAEQAAKNRSVAFVDTESSFSTERFKQIGSKQDLENIKIFTPNRLSEQVQCIKTLSKDHELIIVDSLVSLYRLEQKEDVDKANRNLSSMLGALSRKSREGNAASIVTNQVYESPETQSLEMAGGDIPEYWCSALLQLRRISENNRRTATVRKHRSIPENRSKTFEITDRGIVPKI
jgi:DNA repair protein RadB